MKKIGIIICEDSESWGGEEGKGKFELSRYMANSNEDVTFEVIHGVTGMLPNDEDISSFSGFILGGGRYCVYDEHQWIRRLEEFVRKIREPGSKRKTNLVGICYGHQVIAKALGGEVSRNKSGIFNFGAETIQVSPELARKKFFQDNLGDRKSFKIMEAHGEEVSRVPKGALNLGQSLSCHNEILSYGDNIISFQGHPELIESKMSEVIIPNMKVSRLLSEDSLNEAIKTIANVDTDIMVRLVLSFLTKS